MGGSEINVRQLSAEIRRAVADELTARNMLAMGQAGAQADKPDLGNREADRGAVSMGEDGFPWGTTRWLWGVSVSGAVVTVGAGALRWLGTLYTCSAANVTITANTQYIAWKLTLSGPTLEIDTTPTASMPAGETGVLRGALYKVTSVVVGGNRYVTAVTPWQYGYQAPELPDANGHYEGEVLQLGADDGPAAWGWLKMRVPAP